jgi:hypothetical protein
MQGIEDRNMRKYHHIGIPTAVQRPGETYLDRYDVYCTDDASSSFGIQWMRYGPRCDLPELVKTVAHVVFEALENQKKGTLTKICPNQRV